MKCTTHILSHIGTDNIETARCGLCWTTILLVHIDFDHLPATIWGEATRSVLLGDISTGNSSNSPETINAAASKIAMGLTVSNVDESAQAILAILRGEKNPR